MAKQDKICFHYKYDKTYSIISPTDAYGGVTPKGKLVMNLFSEMHRIPKSQINILDKTHKIDKSKPPILYDENGKEFDKDLMYVDRVIHNTVFLTPESAIEIAFWMIDNILKYPPIEIDKNQLKERFLKMLKIEEV